MVADLTKLGKYEIRRELGRGAMGVVYEGFDPLIERTVAIKTIRPEQVDKSQVADLLARFKREAQAAGRLNHPNIVGIYEFGEDAGVAFIAMEYIKGRELKDYFDENRRFPMKEVERIMSELLGALDHAHSHGVTHRDMKPANVILLDGNASVKVADFGIARIESSELTQAGTVLGTPAYMSPEQFLGQTVDRRSDLFSCGVILYQFLTGEKPFTGAVTTIMHKVLKEEPLAPSTLNATLPGAWDAVIRKAMAKNPDDRYQNAGEFSQAIHDVIAGKALAGNTDATVINLGGDATLVNAPEATVVNGTVVNAPAGIPARPAATPAPSLAQKGGATVVPPTVHSVTPSKSRGMVFAAIAAGVIVVGAGGYLALGKKDAAQSTAAMTSTATAAAPVSAPAAVPAVTPAAQPAAEPGILTISAIGLADPAKFNGDAAAAGAEARADAKRQLVEKALALYVSPESLNKNYEWVASKMLSRSGDFIKTTLKEDAPQTGKDGLVAINTTASVKVRDLQKSFNQMSEKERVDFIRNNGDPKIAVQIQISNADSTVPLPPARSQLAENVIKERVKSFGFRVWSVEGETKTGANAKAPDFVIVGDVKIKVLPFVLPASGLKMTKTALTSWTVKAIDKATGEEIYSNTALPKGDSFNTEDDALAAIGKLVGDEFSKNFFLAHFNFGSQKVNLNISGLPDGVSPLVLRELKSLRSVLDARETAPGKYALELPEGGPSDLVADAVLKPLNAKLGQACFTAAGSSGQDVNVSYAAACAADTVRGKLESSPPAGLIAAPDARNKALRKTT